MFPRDEMDEILQDLVPIMKKQYPRRVPTNENLYDYFISRVRQNLHVVLCFSPVGEKFRRRGKSCQFNSQQSNSFSSTFKLYNFLVLSLIVRLIGFYVGHEMLSSLLLIIFSPHSILFATKQYIENWSNAWVPYTMV